MITLSVEIDPGQSIDFAASEMCGLSRRLGLRVETEFNGVPVYANPDDAPALVVGRFWAKLKQLANATR